MFKIYRYLDEPEEERDSLEDEDESLEDEEGFGDVEDQEEEEEDPNFQGVIRTVPGACLVYKRNEASNTFEELWVYSTNDRNIKYENTIRGSILAGTDIDPNTERSPDGDQTCKTSTVGNVQYLHIRGLPN